MQLTKFDGDKRVPPFEVPEADSTSADRDSSINNVIRIINAINARYFGISNQRTQVDDSHKRLAAGFPRDSYAYDISCS